ncbi:glycosyltransferase family 2 protein [Roseobacter sp. YSTF-M11]|uniref:Glycosyltransferase family 2 protein n=1 Tax=Roseobacter insulae TaxID=2859783 RepID=A0A9X1FXJ4_9RHOB|nr:glycosyltransferase family 2 protein [Roseobacter insulae]MBW4709219.1 glycosyltransferase family 2 protein [Roseobacter insulae]
MKNKGQIVQIAKTRPYDPSQGRRSLVSLVVPVFNEQQSIGPFLDRIEAVFAPLAPTYSYEIIFVNDGSRDATEFAIRSRMQSDPRLGLVNLSRNFGKEAALSAGLDHIRGDACIPIDVDLQDPPELIPDMLKHWEQGALVVNAKRICRARDSWIKRTTASGFYSLFNAMADHQIPRDVGDYRLLDKQVVEVVCDMGERVRFNKALFSWVGFETAEVTFTRPERENGSSTWSYWRLWNFALDGIFSSTTAPLRVWTYAGGLLALMSFLYASAILLRTLIIGVDVPGYASTLILILLFGGLNLFAIGILGEYIGRIYSEVRERPLYVLRSVHKGWEKT